MYFCAKYEQLCYTKTVELTGMVKWRTEGVGDRHPRQGGIQRIKLEKLHLINMLSFVL